MDTKRWTLLVAMIGVLLATAFASVQPSGDQSDFYKERIKFFKENVKPKIDAKRQQLESSISAADKKEITRLRDEIKAKRLAQNELMFKMRESRINGETPDESNIEAMRSNRLAIESLYDQAKVIANNYRPQIDDLLADLRTEMQELRAEMGPGAGFGPGMMGGKPGFRGPGKGMGIGPCMSGKPGAGFGPGMGPGAMKMGRGFGPGFHKGNFGGGPGSHGFGVGGRGGMNIVSFLLWDVNK